MFLEKKIFMVFWSKFSLNINKLVCKLSKTKESFFHSCHYVLLAKMGCKHDQFKNLAIDKLFDLLCRFLHDSFIIKT